MKILIVTPFSLKATGGVSTVVKMWVKEFTDQRHSAIIFTAGKTNTIKSDIQGTDLDIFSSYLRPPYVREHGIRSFLAFLFYYPLTTLQLLKFVKNNKIDIISIQYPLPWMIYFSIIKHLTGIKLFVVFHGNDAHDLACFKRLDRYCLRHLLNAADGIIGVTNVLLEKVRTCFPAIRANFFVIPNGAPADLIKKMPSSFSGEINTDFPHIYIITVGHLIFRKGIDVLIDSLEILAKKNIYIHLVAVGDGSDKKTFILRGKTKKIANLIHFVGNQTYSDTISLIKSSQFFVLASRQEGLPLVIAEAMLCEKAVVATAIDGVPEIVVHNDTGLLVPPDNPEALAEAILKLYQNKRQRDAFSRAGLQRAEKQFSWHVIARQHLSLYASFMQPDSRVKSKK